MKPEQKQSSNILLAIIVAIGFIWVVYQISDVYYFTPQSEEMIKQREKIKTLKHSNDENEQIKANAQQLAKSLVDVEQQYRALKSLIPAEAELPKILDWLAGKAYERNLKLEHFSQGSKITQQGSMNEIPIQVEVLGYYDNVNRFLDDFSRFERVLRIHGVHMTQEKIAPKPSETTSEKAPEKILESQPLNVRAVISFSAYVSKDINKDKGLTSPSNTGNVSK